MRHVAIVGAGYSGTVQAVELLRRGLTVTLIERGAALARGAAYGTSAPDHLLNVRAAGMSAFADAPDHFAAWLANAGAGKADDFAPRRTYGIYLKDLLDQARDEHGDRFRTERDEAVAIEGDARVRLASGTVVNAEAVVLALGNLPPEPPRLLTTDLPAGLYVADPWSGDWLTGLRADDNVLLIGTGLTAIDAILSLDSAGFGGRILALSRRGLIPRAHAQVPLVPAPAPAGFRPDTLTLLRTVRAAARQSDWRSAVDSLRPQTQRLWAEADTTQRRRFLRHLRPWWDVHRHRIAPSIAARIGLLVADGRLTVAAGKLAGITSHRHAEVEVSWRPRGEQSLSTLRVRRVVNCTGPRSDIEGAGEPLLDVLQDAGRIRTDPCRIGIDVDRQCRVLDASGVPSDHIFAIGPLTRSAFWEIVAVPDIRVQARDLARFISGEQNELPRNDARGSR